ncbi:MAG: hypothetical protein JWM33_1050 [Caulobacteraceae bacterium]|nr:hypothetical protein [Caulobacteraceae bacterium]
MTPQTQHLIGSLTPVAVIIVILAIRLPRMLKGRRLRLETLWVRPAIMLGIGALAMVGSPPNTPVEIAAVIAGLALGGAIGWWQGKMMAIGIEPESHQLNVKASPVAVMLFTGLIVLRVGLRTMLEQEANARHLPLALVVDPLIAIVVGLYLAQSIEMYLRASAMLREAKAGGAKLG